MIGTPIDDQIKEIPYFLNAANGRRDAITSTRVAMISLE